MRFAASLVLLAVLGGCASVENRIEKNRPAFDRLSPEERKLVSEEKIGEGMNRDAVRIAWGKPDRITRMSQAGRNFEIWTYYRYQQETIPDYQYVPRRVGRGIAYQSLFSPRYETNASLDRRAVFENDRVVTSELVALP
jgi:hypothetical protein